MHANVLLTTPYVLETLSQFPAGVVHSVYRNTINLSMSGNFISIQSKHSILSPISVITPWRGDELNRLDICAGNAVYYNNFILQVNNSIFLSVKDGNVQSTALAPVTSDDNFVELTSNILSSLRLKDTNGLNHLLIHPDTDTHSPFLKMAQIHIHNCEKYLLAGEWTSAASCICKLIGLGIGLTPCGDDFLCGALAGLTLCNGWEHPFSVSLRALLLQHLSDTNQISAAFLQRALEQQFSTPILSLADFPTHQQIFDKFIQIGHSSGMDTLCGIFFILKNLSSLQLRK